MNEGMPRSGRAGYNQPRQARAAERRPDRMAFWALLGALFTLVVAAASAHATSGGTASPGASSSGEDARFGSRVLSEGMEGSDVEVLNGIVKSKDYATGVRLSALFESTTEGAVKQFQSEAGLASTGVVDRTTSRALRASMSKAGATWYGPGFYGNKTACGKTLRRTTIGVANRSLPCGTKITFAYHGRSIVAPVIDRGPYTRGYRFDLTGATAETLGFTQSETIRYAVARTGSDRIAP
jgi:rare lipoprotein A (peptidoglycan hydrolase)